jgi:hypothetical protein
VQEGERLGEVKGITLLPRHSPAGRITDFNGLFALFLLKIVKIVETFAFGFCTLWVPSPLERELQADCKTE